MSIGKSLKHLANPFDKRNPLRPDNLAKDPLGINAQDLLSDPKESASQAINADGTFAAPSTGYQIAYNAYLAQGSPGANGAAVNSPAWQNSFNSWMGPILAARGAYDSGLADPLDAVQASWFTDGGVGSPGVTASADGTVTEEVPLEQDLMQRTLDQYVYPALEGDAANKEKFAKILAGYQPAMDANRQLVTDLATEDGTTGHSKLATRELANLDEALQSSLGATNERQTRKLADLAPLIAERLNGAETVVTAASLGEQAARDKIVADMASQGYIGGSSFADQSLARATTDARQQGAQAVSAAKLANASDTLGVNNEASDSIWDAKNWGANQKLSTLGADTTRRLSNLETPMSLANSEVNLTNSIDDASWAGLRRSLDALKWWKLGNATGGGDVAAAPTDTVLPSALAAIGPSLVNAGLSMGQANNWWQKPATATATTATK